MRAGSRDAVLMVLMMLTRVELCTTLSDDANVMHAMQALLGIYTGVRCHVLQCNDLDVLLHDAMSGELTDSTPDSWGYRPKEKVNDTEAAKKKMPLV